MDVALAARLCFRCSTACLLSGDIKPGSCWRSWLTRLAAGTLGVDIARRRRRSAARARAHVCACCTSSLLIRAPCPAPNPILAVTPVATDEPCFATNEHAAAGQKALAGSQLLAFITNSVLLVESYGWLHGQALGPTFRPCSSLITATPCLS